MFLLTAAAYFLIIDPASEYEAELFFVAQTNRQEKYAASHFGIYNTFLIFF